MSTEYDVLIRQTVADIKALRKLKKDIDPASGMSVSVRRGVARDNDDVEYDHEKRPWLTMEFSDTVNMDSMIDLLIRDRLSALRFWLNRGGEYSDMLDAALVIGHDFLAAEK
jgi:hypothetical protein